jgi:uncharacterized protein (UPF0248 family)
MHNLVDQRRQFLTSLISYHKQRNLKVPPEIVNGERDGAIKMGDIWVEIVELFMSVLRVGGLEKVCPVHRIVADGRYQSSVPNHHSGKVSYAHVESQIPYPHPSIYLNHNKASR